MLSKIARRIPRRYRLKIKDLIGYSAYANYGFKVDVEKSDNPQHFHFANILGSHRASNLLEPSLAKFLVERGHRVTVTLCDKALPACLACSIWNQDSKHRQDSDFIPPQKLGICGGCYEPARKAWETTGAEILRISAAKLTENYVNDFERKIVKYGDVDLSEDVIAGCLRFLCKGNSDCITQKLWDAYAQSALRVAAFYTDFLDEEQVDVSFSVHGIYVPHGVTNKVMQAKNVSFFNYNTSYREKRFYFTKDNTYHHVLPNETGEELGLGNTPDRDIEEITQYLGSRRNGSQDWQQFNNEPDEQLTRYFENSGFDASKPTAVLFSNVVWDARLHFEDNTYEDMSDWIKDTINCFAKMPERNLIIRTHPGEVVSHSKSRERLRDLDCIKKRPSNVLFIDAEEKISSYALGEFADLNLVFASKMAMELCCMEAPIITCGDAWIKNKGATISPEKQAEYLAYISGEWDDLKAKCDKRQGLAYAHYIFEKKPLFFDFLDPSADRKSFQVNVETLKKEIMSFEGNSLFRIENALKDSL